MDVEHKATAEMESPIILVGELKTFSFTKLFGTRALVITKTTLNKVNTF